MSSRVAEKQSEGQNSVGQNASVMSVPEIDPTRILVAIPALNEERHIERTLESLFDDAPGMAAAKIVVADGGSTDATCAIVARIARQYPNIHLIDNPRRLQSAAVNLIVETQAEPQHDILLRIDAHSYYPPGYVLAVARSLIEHEATALATVMDSGGTGCFQRGAAWATDSKLGSGGSGHRGGTRSGYVDHGHHAGFRLDAFREVGGYDKKFVANEDAEFDHRLTLNGGKIWLDATIRLGYVMRPSVGALARQYWRYGKGRAQTVQKHRMRPRARQMIPPVVFAVNIISLLFSPLVTWMLVMPIGYLVLLMGATALLVLKHRCLCALWAGPALLAMHMSWGGGFLWQMVYVLKPSLHHKYETGQGAE